MGSDKRPYLGKAEIVLSGNKDSDPLLLDDISAPGTKAFAVTGNLIIKGSSPAVT